ncbi:MAG TPA: hypothetical protein VM734_29090 [Kofleriaceae bacterium]|jgi:hypothetical protein|nr:hypothetical protein [Kofleriaceae bacterium]
MTRWIAPCLALWLFACADPVGREVEELTATAAACLTAATTGGETSLCASCECGSCPAEAGRCFDGDPACAALVACEHAAGCTGDACYCGDGLAALTCLLVPRGPCVAEIDAATGRRGLGAVWTARRDPAGALARAEALVACGRTQCATACAADDAACTFDQLACQDRICVPDAAREAARAASAAEPAAPVIETVRVDGAVVWRAGDATRPVLRPGAEVVLTGRGFGHGADVDFAKIMIGNSRVLEADLAMYAQELDIFSQVHHEVPRTHSTWPRDLLRWTPTEIGFRVPVHASRGPLVIQVQKRLPPNESLLRPGEPHLVVDAQTSRIIDPAFDHRCDVVSGLGPAVASAALDVTVDNPGFAALVRQGRAIFWAYDYNIGLAHSVRDLDWTAIFAGTATDPITGTRADPVALFGAYPATRGEVPDEAIDEVVFDPYPQPNPIPGFLLLTPQLTSGRTRGTGHVGYRYAESSHPFKGAGQWIGFNCSSCHGYRVSYERAPGQRVTRVIPGLPNPTWSMKWALLGNFKGITGDEDGPRWSPGKAAIDKTALIYAMPQGAGEHNVVRLAGEGSHTDNDYQFSPIAIPNVTNYMAIRRSLAHTESYVGFEGSYIHSQEPDGAMGSMRAPDLQALTAYMTTLDQDDVELRRVGLHRWLAWQGRLADVDGAGEGAFVASGWEAYPALAARIERGRATFDARCGSCHRDQLGAHTGEQMVRLDQVGRFFAPTIYQKEMQAIRATFLRDLYWVQHRGLLTDGHVRNLRDLVDPARCTPGTPLYDAYYTLHPPRDPGPAGPDFPAAYPATGRRGDVFRIPRARSTAPDDTAARRNRFIERHRYFVTVPWDPDHYYWDFQKLRREYGPAELGTAAPIGLPAAPHPWCAGSAAEVDDLVIYLLTL